MNVSVILSTYNSPDWLEKVLWGYSCQSRGDFEVVIADDGSGDETRRRIEALRQQTGLRLQHVWHEDRGFRKCTILNRGIEAAGGEYLIFSDGDCIPRFDFVAQHIRFAKPGRFLSGGYFKLPMNASQAISREDIVNRRATDPAWLVARGVPKSLKLWKLAAGPRRAALLDALTTTRATWNGHNASGWKVDLVRVNGFDERMEWGGEDRELGERLVNAGLRGKGIRYRAVCVHLDHARGYVREEALRKNREIRDATRRTHAAWTQFGLKHAHETLPQA